MAYKTNLCTEKLTYVYFNVPVFTLVLFTPKRLLFSICSLGSGFGQKTRIRIRPKGADIQDPYPQHF
jgi:hypothetical protein